MTSNYNDFDSEKIDSSSSTTTAADISLSSDKPYKLVEVKVEKSHNVGQLDNNLKKVKNLLDKTKCPVKVKPEE